MIDDDDIIELIGRCYAAVREFAAWPALLERLARAFVADQALLLGHDAALREPWMSMAHGAEAALVDSLGLILVGARPPAGSTWSSGAPFVTQPQLAAGLEHQLGMVEEVEPGVVLALGIFRRRGAAPFGADACAALARVAPHLFNAARISRQLASARATAAAIGEALEKIAAPVMIVDRGARVVSANRAARGLGPVSGLALRNGALRVERAADERALRGAIGAVLGAQDVNMPPASEPAVGALDGAGRAAAPAPRDVAVHGVAGRRLALRVSALGEDDDVELGEARSRALAVVQVLADGNAPDARAQHLAPAYGLSAAEAELLDGLLGGLRLAEIAASRGTSRETARSQLKSIFRKTGVSAQSDLVALAAGAMPPPAHGTAPAPPNDEADAAR
jgi:DNA-binding CsgD family transcriptional regulator